MQLELQSADLKERYCTRLLYAISDAESAAAAQELDDACLLDLEWADLVSTAEAVDVQLEGVKWKFSQITRQQVRSLTRSVHVQCVAQHRHSLALHYLVIHSFIHVTHYLVVVQCSWLWGSARCANMSTSYHCVFLMDFDDA